MAERDARSTRRRRMSRNRRTTVWSDACWLALALSWCQALAFGAEPREVERETREFKVSVDGKGRGKCKFEISRRDDGSDRMHIAAALSFNYVVYEYKYSSTGTEIWKNGR